MSQVFGKSKSEMNASEVIDAEFVFPPDDDIITLRASPRVQPEGAGSLTLSFTDGPIVFENNNAR